MTLVVTYQHAYLPGQEIDLCAEHDGSISDFGVLGPVSHGAHDGHCDDCQALEHARYGNLDTCSVKRDKS